MKKATYFLILMFVIISCNQGKSQNTTLSNNLYPLENERIVSKEDITYYIDPNIGSDNNSGISKDEPWKTFIRVNQLILSRGNSVEILSAGEFKESLFIMGKGTEKLPITIKFAPGRYDFYPQNAYIRKFHISNTNDAPDSLKAIAFYFSNTENIQIKGNGAEIVFRGKVMEICINNCKNVSVADLSFNYKRPTVSEMKVLNTGTDFADVEIHNDSKYRVEDSTLVWIGEGWQHEVQNLWQEFNPKTQKVSRKNLPVGLLRFSELGKNKLRIHFNKNPGFTEGLIYQNRNTFRDYCAVFTRRSKNIVWKNVSINFMHGMGFVSQFCENITFDSLRVAPKKGSGRTCAAWADILHFSGCKGKIEVNNSYLSAANDDAINVHGTHLRIVGVLSKQKIKVRFMHHQSYGFDAFVVGDSIEFVSAKSLLPFSKNVVSQVNKLNDKDVELSFEQDIPNNIQANDVIDNITWTPDVIIRNTKLIHIPTRGILISTRGKVVIENNEFFKTHMSAILIANDANSWFESGYVRDISIKNNKFIECGKPAIRIHPENKIIIKQTAVHENIQISNNFFKLKNNLLLSAKSTRNLKFINNTIKVYQAVTVKSLLHLKACPGFEIKGNQIIDSD